MDFALNNRQMLMYHKTQTNSGCEFFDVKGILVEPKLNYLTQSLKVNETVWL